MCGGYVKYMCTVDDLRSEVGRKNVHENWKFSAE
jgi:hypothetical protein